MEFLLMLLIWLNLEVPTTPPASPTGDTTPTWSMTSDFGPGFPPPTGP